MAPTSGLGASAGDTACEQHHRYSSDGGNRNLIEEGAAQPKANVQKPVKDISAEQRTENADDQIPDEPTLAEEHAADPAGDQPDDHQRHERRVSTEVHASPLGRADSLMQ